jgi:5-methylcytosine-specific restriction protein A
MEIRSVMEDVLPMQGTPRLIDAHSFVWIIQEKRFINWSPDAEQRLQIEQSTEKTMQRVVSGVGGHRNITASSFIRSAAVVKETKKRARGVCQYCHCTPFNDKDGNPYLEVHHVKWLSRGGEDSTSNTVALCPNCHTRMHILDQPEDIEKLKKEIINSSR